MIKEIIALAVLLIGIIGLATSITGTVGIIKDD